MKSKITSKKLKKRALYSINPDVLELFNKLTKNVNRSKLIEAYMRDYIGTHGTDK